MTSHTPKYWSTNEGIQKLDESLSLFSLTEYHRIRIYEIVGAILHLGNIEFKENANGHADISDDSRGHLEIAANLLGIDVSLLRTSLLERNVSCDTSQIR